MKKNDLEKAGFQGFYSIDRMRGSILGKVPTEPGIYAVINPDPGPVSFLKANPASPHKGKDPTVPVKKLKSKWVDDTDILYIGKAQELRQRIGQYLNSGIGVSDLAHWGGTYIWQIDGSENLLIAWLTSRGTPPEKMEAEWMDRFKSEHGCWPFANIQGPIRKGY
jgi:hypothetical protein